MIVDHYFCSQCSSHFYNQEHCSPFRNRASSLKGQWMSCDDKISSLHLTFLGSSTVLTKIQGSMTLRAHLVEVMQREINFKMSQIWTLGRYRWEDMRLRTPHMLQHSLQRKITVVIFLELQVACNY